jgi:hypothetical protein
VGRRRCKQAKDAAAAGRKQNNIFGAREAATDTYLVAFDAASGELLLVATGAVNLLLPGDERLGADGSAADNAAEALLVPLARLVLHLLRT